MGITNIHEAKSQLSKLVERASQARKSSSRRPASRWFALYPCGTVTHLARGANGRARFVSPMTSMNYLKTLLAHWECMAHDVVASESSSRSSARFPGVA